MLAQKQGFGVFVSDMGKVKEPFRQELENHGIEFEEGAHSWERFAGVKTVVKSPGIPDTLGPGVNLNKLLIKEEMIGRGLAFFQTSA